MVLQDELEGTDGIFPSGCTTFISSSAVFSSYSLQQNDTIIIPERESNEGVYHVDSIVSDNVLILNRTSVTSAASITWQSTKMLNRIVQDASDEVDEHFADLSDVIAVPFDKTMLQCALSALDDLDESIPLSLAGYYLDLDVIATTFSVGVTITGYGDWQDWRNAGVTTKFTTDDTPRPTTDAKSQTESLTFTAAGTMTTTKRYREITEIGATYSDAGTLTVRLNVPRQIKRIAALETIIQLVDGNYLQGTPNRSEWLESRVERLEGMYEDYRTGARRLAELTESTIQRGLNRSVKIQRR